MNAAAQLAAGVSELALDLGEDRQRQLLDYLRLLARWNRTYNLTAARDEATLVSAHLLDSLSVLPHLGTIRRLADIGSGAGLPGIPLALARPDIAFDLVEPTQKKASFLTQAKIELGLSNVSIHCGRAEDLARSAAWQPVDAVIARALCDLAEFVRLAAGLLAPGGRLLAMKGPDPSAEIAALPAGWAVLSCLPLSVPGIPARRYLVIIEKV